MAAKDLSGYVKILLMFQVSFTFLWEFWGWRKGQNKKETILLPTLYNRNWKGEEFKSKAKQEK